MRDTVGILLVGALWMSALLSIWYSLDHGYRVRKLQEMYQRQPEMGNLNAAAQSLANEAVEYSKRNPAIDPILVQFDLKPKTAAAQTNQPARTP